MRSRSSRARARLCAASVCWRRRRWRSRRDDDEGAGAGAAGRGPRAATRSGEKCVRRPPPGDAALSVESWRAIQRAGEPATGGRWETSSYSLFSASSFSSRYWMGPRASVMASSPCSRATRRSASRSCGNVVGGGCTRITAGVARANKSRSRTGNSTKASVQAATSRRVACRRASCTVGDAGWERPASRRWCGDGWACPPRRWCAAGDG